MDLESRFGDPADGLFRPPDLPGGDGVQIIRIRVAGVIPAGDGKGVPPPEELFVRFVAPQRDAHHHVGETFVAQNVGRRL